MKYLIFIYDLWAGRGGPQLLPPLYFEEEEELTWRKMAELINATAHWILIQILKRFQILMKDPLSGTPTWRFPYLKS